MRAWEVSATLKHKPPSSRNEFMRTGRFGGGWNWALGFELGPHALVINLLIVSLAIRWKWDRQEDQ